MSWTDKEIDQLFKESAEGVSFNYSDEYWKEMEAMLPQKKKKDFLWFFTAFAFLGLVSLGFFRSVNPLDTNVANQLVATNTSTESNQQSTSENETLESSSFEEIQKNKELIETVEVVKSENGMNNTSAVNRGKIEESNSAIKLMQNLELNDDNESSDEVLRSPHSQAEDVYVDGINLGSLDNWLISGLRPHALSSNIDKSLAQSSIQPTRNKRILVSPYLEIHCGLSEAPLANSERIGNYYGAGAGLQLNSPFWTTTLGVNGSAYNFSDVQLTHFSKTYSYGSRYTTHELNYSNIYRVEGVISVGRNFGKHQVNIGLRPSYIISNSIDYVEIDQIKDTRVEREVVGFTEGMNRFGLKSTIGYAYSVAPSWTAGVNLGLQMRSTFEKDFLGNSASKLPIDGQIYIRKTLSFGK